MTKEWSDLKAGTVVAGVVSALLALAAMLVSALLARLLPQREVGGYFLLLQAVTTLAQVAMLGTNISLQRLLAVPASRGDWPVVRAVLGRSLRLIGFAFPAVCVVLLLAWRPLMEHGLGEPSLAPLWLLAIPLVATQMVDELGSVFFRATGRARLGLAVLNLPRQLLFVGVLAALWIDVSPQDLREIVWLRVGVTALVAVLEIGLIAGAVRGAAPQAPANSVPSAGELARTSFPMLVTILAATLHTGLELWFLGAFTGTAEVGVYATMSQLAALLVMLPSVVNLVMPPMLAAMHADGRMQDLQTLMRRVSTLSTWGVAVGMGMLLLFGRDVIDLVFGASYGRGYPVLVLLALGQVFNVAAGSPGWLLQMTGHQKSLMQLSVLSTALKALITWWSASHYGLLGVAVSSSAVLCLHNVVMVWMSRRLVGVRTWTQLNPMSALKALTSGSLSVAGDVRVSRPSLPAAAPARLVVVGGQQREPGVLRRRLEWSLFAEARAVRVDLERGTSEVCMSYTTPPGLCPAHEPSVLFKAGSWDGEQLLLCTQTEVLRVDPQRMEVVEHYSHPLLNDVHHVARIGGRLHIVDTGLDALLVLDADSGNLEVRSALDGDPWQRFDRSIDYRLVASTKPHLVHPNFVFETRDGVWLTRFVPRDAICLDKPGHRIEIGVGQPHDGHVVGDRVWFTTTNGHIVVADATRGAVIEDYDLNKIDGDAGPLGWCRGLHLDGDIAYVGFTRLRQTRWGENVAWLRGLGTSPHPRKPTRVVAYDLRRREKLAEWNVEHCGLQAIFSVFAEPTGRG